jgi:chlorite dismutase
MQAAARRREARAEGGMTVGTKTVIYRDKADGQLWMVRVEADNPTEAQRKAASYGAFVRFAQHHEAVPLRVDKPQRVY